MSTPTVLTREQELRSLLERASRVLPNAKLDLDGALEFTPEGMDCPLWIQAQEGKLYGPEAAWWMLETMQRDYPEMCQEYDGLLLDEFKERYPGYSRVRLFLRYTEPAKLTIESIFRVFVEWREAVESEKVEG